MRSSSGLLLLLSDVKEDQGRLKKRPLHSRRSERCKRLFIEVNFIIFCDVGVFSVFDQWKKLVSVFGLFLLEDVYAVCSCDPSLGGVWGVWGVGVGGAEWRLQGF